jgi:hypothetical protein
VPQLEQLIRKATKVAADADGKARKVQARAAAGYLYAYQQAKQQHSSSSSRHTSATYGTYPNAHQDALLLWKLVWGC